MRWTALGLNEWTRMLMKIAWNLISHLFFQISEMWAYSLIDSFVNLIAFFLNTHLKVLLLLFWLPGSEIFTKVTQLTHICFLLCSKKSPKIWINSAFLTYHKFAGIFACYNFCIVLNLWPILVPTIPVQKWLVKGNQHHRYTFRSFFPQNFIWNLYSSCVKFNEVKSLTI